MLFGSFGDGYKLSLALHDESETAWARADDFVRGRLGCAGARRVTAVGRQVAYVLPPKGLDVASLFMVSVCLCAAVETTWRGGLLTLCARLGVGRCWRRTSRRVA